MANSPAPVSSRDKLVAILRHQRMLQTRLLNLQAAVQDRDWSTAFNSLCHCIYLERTEAQTRFLMKLAFNLAVNDEVAQRHDASMWARKSLLLARELDDCATSDRCLLVMAGHLVKLSDFAKAWHCTSLVQGKTFCSLCIEILCMVKTASSSRNITRCIEQAVWMSLGTMAEVKNLLCAVEDGSSVFADCVYDHAFQRFQDDNERAALFLNRLRQFLSRRLFDSCTDIITAFTQWVSACALSKSQSTDICRQFLQTCSVFVRYLKVKKDHQRLKSACEAIIFLCLQSGEDDNKALFLTSLVEALLSANEVNRAEKVLHIHKINASDPRYFEVLVKLALVKEDYSALKRCLIENLRQGDLDIESYKKVLLIAAKGSDTLNSDTILTVLKKLHDTAKRLPGCRSLLPPIRTLILRFQLRKWMTCEQDTGATNILASEISESAVELCSAVDLGFKKSLFHILWNIALQTKSAKTTYDIFHNASALAAGDDKLEKACLLMYLAAAVECLRPSHEHEVDHELIGKQLREHRIISRSFRVAERGNIRMKGAIACYLTEIALLSSNNGSMVTQVVNHLMGDKSFDYFSLFCAAILISEKASAKKSMRKYHLNLIEEAIFRAMSCNLSEYDEVATMFQVFCEGLLEETDTRRLRSAVSKLTGLFSRSLPPSGCQETIFRILAAIWNTGVRVSLSGAADLGKELKDISKQLKRLVPDFAAYLHHVT